MNRRRVCLGLALMLGCGVAVAQQQVKGTVPGLVHVYVVVTTLSGQPVTDLGEDDFSLWDNNVLPMKITSFRLVRKNSNRLPQPALVSMEPQNGHDDGVVAYELTFVPVAGPPDEYHSLGVRVDRPNLKVQAPQGYFARP